MGLTGPTGGTGPKGPTGPTLAGVFQDYGHFYTLGQITLPSDATVPLVKYLSSGGITFSNATSTLTLTTPGVYQITMGYAWQGDNTIAAEAALAVWVNGAAILGAPSYGYLGVENLFNMNSATFIVNITIPNSTVILTNQSGGTIHLLPATATAITSSYLTIVRLR